MTPRLGCLTAACTAALFLACPSPAHAGGFQRTWNLPGWLRQISFALHDFPEDKTVLKLLARADPQTDLSARDLRGAIHAFNVTDALPLLARLPGGYLDDLEPWARSTLGQSRSHRKALFEKLTNLTDGERADLLEHLRILAPKQRAREKVLSILMTEKHNLEKVLWGPEIAADPQVYSLLDKVVLGRDLEVKLLRPPEEYAKAWELTDAARRPVRLYSWLRTLALSVEANGAPSDRPFGRQDLKDLRAFLAFARRELDTAARTPIQESPSAGGNVNVIALTREACEKPPPFMEWAEESWQILQSLVRK